MHRRLGRIISTCAVSTVVLAACSSTTTSASPDARGGATTTSLGPHGIAVLPSADQPPDPCDLLSTAAVSRAFGRTLTAFPAHALPGHAPDGARSCSWVTPGAAHAVSNSSDPLSTTAPGFGVVTMSIYTDRGLVAGAQLEKQKDGAGYATVPSGIRAMSTAAQQYGWMSDGSGGRPISGVGTSATYVELGSQQVSLLTVSGPVMIALSFLGAPRGDHLAGLESLARNALAAARS